jgi:iron complex outermembrane receptor protein
LVASSLSIFAQADSTKNKYLPEVVISENRIATPLSRVSQNIQIITRADINRTPARSVQEVLSFAGGLDVRQRGPGGVQADIGIRGGSFEQTLLLINGIKLTDPQTAHHIMNIPLPLSAIDRIDILKGPGSRVYGQNAYSGAINLITKVPDSLKVEARLYAGDFNTLGTSLFAAVPSGRLKQTLSFSSDQSAGHQEGSDFSVFTAFHEAIFILSKRHILRILNGYTARNFGAYGYYTDTARFKSPWEKGVTILSAISHEYAHNGFSLKSRAYRRQNNDEFRLKKMVPSFYTNIHETEILAFEMNAAINWKWGTTGLGAEGRKEDISSSNLGDRYRELYGAFLEHRIHFGKIADLRAGMYSNYFDSFGWKHFPGAELGFQLTNRSRVYANWGKSFRIPSYTELYYQDPNNSSNPLLSPEEAVSFEIGYAYKRNSVRSSLNWFTRHSENMIDYYREPSVNAGKWTPRNISKVDLNGVEFNLDHAFDWGGKMWRLTGAGFSYTYMDATAPSDTNSRYALTMLRHQWIGKLEWGLMNKLYFSLKARYLSRITYDPYWLLDTRCDLRVSKVWTSFMELTNLTNTDYVEAGFVRMPGRWFRVGLHASFSNSKVGK